MQSIRSRNTADDLLIRSFLKANSILHAFFPHVNRKFAIFQI